jgi:hypothetical protein
LVAGQCAQKCRPYNKGLSIIQEKNAIYSKNFSTSTIDCVAGRSFYFPACCTTGRNGWRAKLFAMIGYYGYSSA